MHATKVIESGVGAAVLVDQGLLMAQRQNPGDGLLILKGHANLECFTEAIDQITEPISGLWRQLMPPPSKQLQAIENVEQRIGPARLFRQAFALRPPDFSLCGIFVKVAKDRIDVRTHIQSVNPVSLGFSEKGGISVERSERTYLNVTPILLCKLALQSPQQIMQVSRFIY
jgi:hypothetical protein